MYRQTLLRIMQIKTVIKYHCTTIAVGKRKSPTTLSFGEDVRKWGCLTALGAGQAPSTSLRGVGRCTSYAPEAPLLGVHPGDMVPRLLKRLLKDLAALCVRVPNRKHLETSILSPVEYLYSSTLWSYENARTTVAHNHRTRLPKDAYMRFS